MATWTDIDDARLEPGKPIRSVDGLALRDNPVAIAEGAEGAPKVEIFEALFTASGAFVVPKTGRYFVDIVGGGGRGGGNGTNRGALAGGRAGRWISVEMSLSAGETLPVVVGAAGGSSSFNGVTAAAGTSGDARPGASDNAGGDGERGAWGNVSGGTGDSTYGTGGRGGVGYGAGGGGSGPAQGSTRPGGAGAPGVVRIRW